MSVNREAGCAVRVGFFVLRPCGAPTAGTCSACQRPTCGEHLDESSVCIECATKEAVPTEGDERWAWFARNRALRQFGLRPFFDGSVDFDDDYYDDWDLRPLVVRGTDEADGASDLDLFDS